MEIFRRNPLRIASIIATVVVSLAGAGLLVQGLGIATDAAGPAGSYYPPPFRPSLAAAKSSGTLGVTCRAPHHARPGQTVLVDYTIESAMEGTVGLGVSLRVPGDPRSVRGIDDEVITRPVGHGANPARHEFTFPVSLRSGPYEIRVGVYPDDGGQADTLADAPCGTVTVR